MSLSPSLKLSAITLAIASLFASVSAEATTYIYRKPVQNLVAEPANQHAMLSVGPAGLSFPNTTENTQSAGQVINLTNSGNIAVTGLSIGTTGEFSTSSTCLSSLAAGGSCTATVRFTPTSVGAKTGVVSIASSNSSAGTVSLSGTSVSSTHPAVGVSSTALSYSSSNSPQLVTITNTGDADLVLGSVVLGGTNPSDFTKVTDTCSSQTVITGGTCSVSVSFTPSYNTVGTSSGQILFANNAAGSPHYVTLSGSTAPFIQVDPATLAFGTTTNSQSVTVSNTGNAVLNVSTLTLGGTDSSNFAFTADTCTGQAVNPGSSCSFSVGFAPLTAGAKSASVSIADNASGSPHSVALTGTGTASISVTPTTAAFGSAITPISATVSNTGNTPVTLGTIAKSGTNSAEFSVVAGQDGCSGQNLAPNTGSCTFKMGFNPSSAGAKSASFNITGSQSTSASVAATGSGASSFIVTGSPAATQNFANTYFGSYATSDFTVNLQNTGNYAATFTNPTFSGTNAGDFTVGSNTCTSIAVGGSCAITVRFSPLGAGPRTGSASIAGTSFTFNGNGFVNVATQAGGYKSWADGSLASNCLAYRLGQGTGYQSYTGSTGDGKYRIQPSGQAATDVYCDMTTDGGGWTMVAGASASDTNHFTAGSVSWSSFSASATGKFADTFINAAKSTTSASSIAYKLTANGGASYFPGSCVFNGNGGTSAATAAAGDCLKFVKTYTATPSWTIATRNSDGCGAPIYYISLSSMVHDACSLSTYYAANGGLTYGRWDERGISSSPGIPNYLSAGNYTSSAGSLWVR